MNRQSSWTYFIILGTREWAYRLLRHLRIEGGTRRYDVEAPDWSKPRGTPTLKISTNREKAHKINK